MATIDAFRKEIFQLISENEIPEAIGKLMELYPSPEGTYYDDLLLLSRQFQDLTDRQMSGLVNHDNANIEKNRITQGLIHIVSNLHTDPVAAQHFGISPVEENTSDPPTKSRRRSKWLWLVPVGFLVVIGAVYLASYRHAGTGPEAKPQAAQTEETDQSSKLSENETAPTQPNSTEPAEENEKAKIDQPRVEPNTKPPKETNTEASLPLGPKRSAHSSPESAQTLQPGEMITATLLSREDVHYYNFPATDDGRVVFKLRNFTATYSPTVSIFDPDGNRLIGTMARKGNPVITWFRAKKGATYRIEIGNRNSDPGEYKLELAYQ